MKIRNLLLPAVLLLISAISMAEEEEGAGAKVGPGKAVEAVGKEGLRLSSKAAAAIGLKTAPLSGNSPFRVPISSLVFFRDEQGVYRLRAGWLKLVEVELDGKTAKDGLIESKELRSGDAVVVSGAALLRVAELNVASGEAHDDDEHEEKEKGGEKGEKAGDKD